MGKNKSNNGFEYYLDEEKIKEYSKWSPSEKLRWLSEWNKLRRYYPKEIIESHERFRHTAH